MRSLVSAILIPVLCLSAAPVAAQTTEADVFVAQAVLDIDEQRYDDAVANLRRALEMEPGHVEALFYLGAVHLAQNRPGEAVAPLERARALAPTDLAVALQLGVARFALKDYDRAQPLLEEVFAAEPTHDGLGYYVGLMRYRQKDYQGALRAFRAGRATNPELQQLVRFYTGLALAVLGQSAQATAELEQALRLAPGSALTGPAERLRDTIVAARRGERRLSAELRLGVFYDDNVPVAPGFDPGDRLVPELRRGDRESFGELVGARAEYVWYRSALVDAAVGYSFFATFNNDLPEFDVKNHLVSLSATRKVAVHDMPGEVGLQYAWDILLLGDEAFIRRHTVTGFGALAESNVHLTQVFARYQRKDFDDAPVKPTEDRDADNAMVGALHLVRFAQDRHFIKVGYQFDWEAAEGGNYDYVGNRLQAGFQYTLPWKDIRFKYDLDVHLRQYLHRNSILPSSAPGTEKRHDREIVQVVRAELPLPHSLTLAAEGLFTDNRSNLAVFDYERDVFSLILSWTY